MAHDHDVLVKGRNSKGKAKYFAVSADSLKDYRKGNFDYSNLEKLRKGTRVGVVVGERPIIQKDGKIIFSAETIVDLPPK